MTLKNLFILAILCSVVSSFAADNSGKIDPGQNFSFADKKWVNTAKEAQIIQHKGKEALRLLPARGDAIAYVRELEFINGTIELDIAAIPQFTGLVFRVRNNNVYEGIYFRPQNSRHDDPARKAHTVQYISHPGNTWYYLRENYPGKYEAHADLPPDEWFHVKVIVKDSVAKVFVNDAGTPCLVINDLKQGISSGSVGVWCGNGSGGTFANLKITPAEVLTGTKVTGKAVYTPEQQFLFDTFKNRRSVRKFKSTAVPKEHILKILDEARYAPSAGNQQPWKFLVIQDRNKLEPLEKEALSWYIELYKEKKMPSQEELSSIQDSLKKVLKNVLSAPVYVAVLVDIEAMYPDYILYDGTLAAENLMIAARALGYGTGFFTTFFPEEKMKNFLNIPGQYKLICFTPIGIPEEWPKTPSKKNLDEVVVFDSF